MSGKDNLISQIKAGRIIKPWLILGPFYQDFSERVQGVTLFEKKGSETGRAVMNEIIEEAKPILFSRVYEGEKAKFLGEASRWTLVRRPEKYLSWGQFKGSNHLGAAFLATLIVPEHPGITQFKLLTSSRVLVAINGKVVYDTDAHPVKAKNGIFEYSFRADLQPGDNLLRVGMFRLGRMAQIGCRLEATEQTVNVNVPLAESIPLEMRSQIETEVVGLHLERDIFCPEHGVGITLSKAPTRSAFLKVQLLSADGGIILETKPTRKGPVILSPGTDLTDGKYKIVLVWKDPKDKVITAVTYDILKLTPTSPLIGYKHLEERKGLTLEYFATHTPTLLEEGAEQDSIWAQLARYALGRYGNINEGVIRNICSYIAARKDCSDFLIQSILCLMYWEREKPRLSREINALMKDTVLRFKYWVDEPGDTVMFMDSENHRMLFHVAEWLAGQLFPTEEFTNSHQRGLYHSTKGRMYITEWLRQRGRFGFDEWHSNIYYALNIFSLINVYDFTIDEDYKLQQMAGALLDYMFFNLAADTFHGVFGTTHGRSYGRNIKYPDLERTSPICWLLYGEGNLGSEIDSGMAPVRLATSRYRLPEMFAKIATDHSIVVESHQRQGIFIRGIGQSANFIVYRTPDYLLSGLQDYRKGAYPSTHVAQVTLENKIVIFWSCPHTCGEGGGLRPDYWSGNTTLPRVIQHRNVLALTWQQSKFSWMTHCFFEQSRFDEVRFEDNWVFARMNRGYVGIYSQHGMVIGEHGQYAGRELICYAPENTWIVECGRKADWDSFDEFVRTLKDAKIEEDKGTLIYFSPSIGKFVTGWDIVPTVNDTPIQTHEYSLVNSIWAHSDFGSGKMLLCYDNERREIWFNQ